MSGTSEEVIFRLVVIITARKGARTPEKNDFKSDEPSLGVLTTELLLK